MHISVSDLEREVTFKTSRSGGKGGQNVNKVSSKVELNLNVNESALFTREQKELIRLKLGRRINSEGILQVITEEERSQYRNKQRGLEKLLQLLVRSLHQPAMRKATKPGRSAIEKRLKNKQARSMKKLSRRMGRSEEF